MHIIVMNVLLCFWVPFHHEPVRRILRLDKNYCNTKHHPNILKIMYVVCALVHSEHSIVTWSAMGLLVDLQAWLCLALKLLHYTSKPVPQLTSDLPLTSSIVVFYILSDDGGIQLFYRNGSTAPSDSPHLCYPTVSVDLPRPRGLWQSVSFVEPGTISWTWDGAGWSPHHPSEHWHHQCHSMEMVRSHWMGAGSTVLKWVVTVAQWCVSIGIIA